MKLKLPEGSFKAYLFDCDGTIADSMPLHYIAWKKALGEWGCEFDEDLFYSWGGMSVAARAMCRVRVSLVNWSVSSPVRGSSNAVREGRNVGRFPVDGWALTGSNRRPFGCKPNALPAELSAPGGV